MEGRKEGSKEKGRRWKGGKCFFVRPDPSMFAIKSKHHVITMFAVRECGADLFFCKWEEGFPESPPLRPGPAF